MKNHYQSLGIKHNSTIEEIKTAYRKLALKFHPDKNDGDSFFSDRFKDIQEAYEVLSNTETRKAYDREWNNFYNSKNSAFQEPNRGNTTDKTSTEKNTEQKQPKYQYGSEYSTREEKSSSSLIFIFITLLVVGFVFMVTKKANSNNYQTDVADSTVVEVVDTSATDVYADTSYIDSPAAAVEDTKPFREIAKIQTYTEEELREFLDDYYGFYRRDFVYRNPKFKKISDREYQISLEESMNKSAYRENDFFWDAQVLRLEIDYDGKYKISFIML